MNAQALLEELRGVGFRFRTDARMVYVSPAGKLTPELAERIRAVKPELIALLRDEDEAERRLRPFGRLLSLAEIGGLTRRMQEAGLDRVDMGPGRTTADPDTTAWKAAQDVRAISRDPARRRMGLWQHTIEDRMRTLEWIAAVLEVPLCEAATFAAVPDDGEAVWH